MCACKTQLCECRLFCACAQLLYLRLTHVPPIEQRWTCQIFPAALNKTFDRTKRRRFGPYHRCGRQTNQNLDTNTKYRPLKTSHTWPERTWRASGSWSSSSSTAQCRPRYGSLSCSSCPSISGLIIDKGEPSGLSHYIPWTTSSNNASYTHNTDTTLPPS